MANFYLDIKSDFKPYTFEEMLKPVALEDAYHKDIEEQLALLSSQLNLNPNAKNEGLNPAIGIIEGLEENEIDKPVYDTYMQYQNDLRTASNLLLEQGLGPYSRPILNKLRTRYTNEIAPIGIALTERKSLMSNYLKNKLEDQSWVTERNPSSIPLKEFINNPGTISWGNTASGEGVRKLAGAAAKKFSELPNARSAFENEAGYITFETITGLLEGDLQEVLDVIDRKNLSESEKNELRLWTLQLRNIYNDAVNSTGVMEWGDEEAKEKIKKYAKFGLYEALGKAEYEDKEDKEDKNKPKKGDEETSTIYEDVIPIQAEGIVNKEENEKFEEKEEADKWKKGLDIADGLSVTNHQKDILGSRLSWDDPIDKIEKSNEIVSEAKEEYTKFNKALNLTEELIKEGLIQNYLIMGENKQTFVKDHIGKYSDEDVNLVSSILAHNPDYRNYDENQEYRNMNVEDILNPLIDDSETPEEYKAIAEQIKESAKNSNDSNKINNAKKRAQILDLAYKSYKKLKEAEKTKKRYIDEANAKYSEVNPITGYASPKDAYLIEGKDHAMKLINKYESLDMDVDEFSTVLNNIVYDKDSKKWKDNNGNILDSDFVANTLNYIIPELSKRAVESYNLYNSTRTGEDIDKYFGHLINSALNIKQKSEGGEVIKDDKAQTMFVDRNGKALSFKEASNILKTNTTLNKNNLSVGVDVRRSALYIYNINNSGGKVYLPFDSEALVKNEGLVTILKELETTKKGKLKVNKEGFLIFKNKSGDGKYLSADQFSRLVLTNIMNPNVIKSKIK
jgi:hypothetical protein